MPILGGFKITMVAAWEEPGSSTKGDKKIF